MMRFLKKYITEGIIWTAIIFLFEILLDFIIKDEIDYRDCFIQAVVFAFVIWPIVEWIMKKFKM